MPDLIKGTNIDNYLMYATMIGVIVYGLYQASPTLTIFGASLVVVVGTCFALHRTLNGALQQQVFKSRRGTIRLTR